MATSQCRSALVASVAQALSFAINDPTGHNSWALSHHRDSPCKRRRGAAETQRSATVFDSSAIPPIGIEKYLMRLSVTFRCSDASFIAALIVVDRLLQYDGGRLPLTMRNVHRIFFASLVVAVKYHEDLVYSNSHYAKAGGVHLREVNRLERVLLMALDFDLRIAPEQYETYEAALLALCDCSPRKDSVNATEGVPRKPLAVEAPPEGLSTNPPQSALQVSALRDEASLEAPTIPPKPRPTIAPAPATALRRKAAAMSVRPMEFCAPWVVPPDRAILNVELGMLAVPASM